MTLSGSAAKKGPGTGSSNIDGRPALRNGVERTGGVATAITKTLFVGPYFEVDVTPQGPQEHQSVRYYFFGDRRIGQRTKPASGPEEFRFLLSDYLSSQAASTDWDGTTVQRVSYLPYGAIRMGNQTGNYGFTDQRLESSGLHYFGNGSGYGRFYDSAIGVWTQPDTDTDGDDGLAHNRFAYVRNNPLRFGDSSGHCICYGPVYEAGLGFFGRAWDHATELAPGFAGFAAAFTFGGPSAVGIYPIAANVAAAYQVSQQGLDIFWPTVDAIGRSYDDAVSGDPRRAGAVGFDIVLLSASAGFAPGMTRFLPAIADGEGVQAAVVGVRPRTFWTDIVDFRGIRVYQRPDLIDPARIDSVGNTSLDLMQSGRPPIGPDNRRIQLHHMLQTPDSPIAEVSQTFADRYGRILHINPRTIPSGIDRTAFNDWRQAYWIMRAEDFR